MIPDLNCDLGEGEPKEKTGALMRSVSSANVGCGVHAGSAATMRTAIRLALENGILIGAHPGLPGNFGRAETKISPAEFRDLVFRQVNELNHFLSAAGGRLHHIKLHGALYHLAEQDRRIAESFLENVHEHWPGIIIYAHAGGLIQTMAANTGPEVWPEGFLDRKYRDDGTLVPRSEPGAMLRINEVFARLSALLTNGKIKSMNGGVLKIQARTWCIHSDSPDSVACGKLARRVFSAFDLTAEQKRALISELTEHYEINAGSGKIHPSLG